MAPTDLRDTGILRQQSQREMDIVMEILREFSEDMTWRATFAMQWEEAALLVAPEHSNTFFQGSWNWPGQKKTYLQVDASGMMAAQRFGAICNSLLTPENSFWHQLCAPDDLSSLKKDRATRLWFEQAQRLLFSHRYAYTANFISQNQANYHLLGVFGNMCMFTDEYQGVGDMRHIRGLRYQSVPLGELYLREDNQGQVVNVKRYFRRTAEQIYRRWPETFPESLRSALESGSQQPFWLIHRVCPTSDYDPARLDARGKPYSSVYISVEAQAVLQEGGYNSFPYAVGRYTQAPGEPYGRGPAQHVLPALKTLNAEKRIFLKTGHRAADPVLLTADDGLLDISLRPGAMNKGGMSADGKALVGVLPTGNVQINKEMMDEERNLINDAFLVSLFQILLETPQMTATEVIERTNEKGILLAPTVGRQSSEYLGPMIHRELDLLSRMRKLPPMPPLLREAGGSYKTEFTSPMARAMRAQDASGFIRTVESVKELVNITQDASLLDPFDFDTAIPAIAEIQGVPESWMADDDAVQKKRQARAKAQQQQQAIQAMPAQAAMMKAQAVAAQAGGQGQPAQPQQQPPPAAGP